MACDEEEFVSTHAYITSVGLRLMSVGCMPAVSPYNCVCSHL